MMTGVIEKLGKGTFKPQTLIAGSTRGGDLTLSKCNENIVIESKQPLFVLGVEVHPSGRRIGDRSLWSNTRASAVEFKGIVDPLIENSKMMMTRGVTTAGRPNVVNTVPLHRHLIVHLKRIGALFLLLPIPLHDGSVVRLSGV